MNTSGERFKATRVELGWSRAEVVDRLAEVGVHVTESQVREWERRNTLPSAEQIAGLAAAIGFRIPEARAIFYGGSR